jgi:O-antigen ligase
VDHITVTYIILSAAGLIGLASFAYLILIPAWTAYGRTWERLAAAFLSMFVLAAFAGTGLAIGLVLLYYWDEILNLIGIQSAIAPFL